VLQSVDNPDGSRTDICDECGKPMVVVSVEDGRVRFRAVPEHDNQCGVRIFVVRAGASAQS
jgi:hypothetical protein